MPPIDPDVEDFGYTQFFTSIDALVMASITYKQVLRFGAWVYPGKQTYVLTRRSLRSPRSDIAMVQTGVDGVIEQTPKGASTSVGSGQWQTGFRIFWKKNISMMTLVVCQADFAGFLW